ncbi:MAG: DUF1854 domain-containing protein [Ruminococcus sp.]|nr:DUF1854 domain-containing protein [Ruminococcus sp.]
MNSTETFELDKLTLLDCSKIEFELEPSGFLTLRYDGQEYHRVSPTRLIPFYSKTTYISLSLENEEMEFEEIGVIKDMAALEKKQYEILDKYLEYKYYMPEITKVHSIKDNMRGSLFVRADTSSGEKTIVVKDWYQNFRMLTDKYLYVNDSDGNKYFCADISKLDKKSRNVLEMFT